MKPSATLTHAKEAGPMKPIHFAMIAHAIVLAGWAGWIVARMT